MTETCSTTYFAETRDFGGEWFQLTDQHATPARAMASALRELARRGYRDAPVRVVRREVSTTDFVFRTVHATTAEEVDQ